MANNYQESSSFLTIPEDKIGKAQAIIDAAVAVLEDEDNEESNGYCGCNVTLEDKGVWFCGDESCNVEHVAEIARELVEQLEIDEPFFCSWAYTCSKPRIGEFGGGAFVIMRGRDTYWVDAMSHVMDFARN
jgi:hypothetical protein